jgi:hypothetical protein
VEAAQRVLEEQVEALTSGRDWRRFLDFQSKLHRYSPNNVMLIWAQHVAAFAEGRVSSPEPTCVAGYRTWRALGRQVERGQRGYAILAPVVVKRRVAVGEDSGSRTGEPGEDTEATETGGRRTSLRGFRIEHVFDVSQTSGQEIPKPVVPKLLTGAAPAGLKAAVKALIEERGFTVESVPSSSALGGANGTTEWESSRVRVRADMDEAAQVKTLIHEAGHVLLHGGPEARTMTRARKEVEAESVAYVVAAAHGMATDDYSFPYVMTWAGTEGAAAVRATQARVASAALRIIERSPGAHGIGGRPHISMPPASPSITATGADLTTVVGGVPC